MTVCIAMMLHNRPKPPVIVFTADRLISTGTINFEGGLPKIQPLFKHTFVMTSSDSAVLSDEIVIKTQKRFIEPINSGEDRTVEQIVNALSEECKLKFELEIEEKRKQVYARYGFTPEEFKSKSKEISEKIVQDIIEGLREAEYDFRTNYFSAGFLIVGIDTDPHIFVVDELGKIGVFDHIGFATIGSGQSLAFPEIAKSEYSPVIGEFRAVVSVYNAKKEAERVSGVGEKTDLWILRRDEENNIILLVANDNLKKQLDRNIETLRTNEKNLNESIMMGLAKFQPKELFDIVKL